MSPLIPTGKRGYLHGYSIGLMIKRSRVQVPAGAVENFLLQGQLSVLTFILVLVSVPPHVTAVVRKDPGHSTKSAGYS